MIAGTAGQADAIQLVLILDVVKMVGNPMSVKPPRGFLAQHPGLSSLFVGLVSFIPHMTTAYLSQDLLQLLR